MLISITKMHETDESINIYWKCNVTMMGLVLCSKTKDCRTFCVCFCNIVIYGQFGNEVETSVNLASAALMHTGPAKVRCSTVCFCLEISWFSVC